MLGHYLNSSTLYGYWPLQTNANDSSSNGYNMSSAFRCFLWEFGYNLVGQQIEPSIVGALPSGLRGSLVLGQ